MQFDILRFGVNYPRQTIKKSVGGNLCLLRCIYTFADSRGRLSLQGKIKLPYENHPLQEVFSYV